MLETSEEQLFSERRLVLTSSGCSPPLQHMNVAVSSPHPKNQKNIQCVVYTVGYVSADNVTLE